MSRLAGRKPSKGALIIGAAVVALVAAGLYFAFRSAPTPQQPTITGSPAPATNSTTANAASSEGASNTATVGATPLVGGGSSTPLPNATSGAGSGGASPAASPISPVATPAATGNGREGNIANGTANSATTPNAQTTPAAEVLPAATSAPTHSPLMLSTPQPAPTIDMAPHATSVPSNSSLNRSGAGGGTMGATAEPRPTAIHISPPTSSSGTGMGY